MKKPNKRPRPPLKALPRRAKIAIVALVKLLYFRPAYLLLAFAISLVFYEFVYWFLNLGLFHYLMTTEYLPLADKIGIIIGSYTNVFSIPVPKISALLLAVSILQGISVAALVYAIRRDRAVNKNVAKEFGGTGVAGIFSVLGLGCIPCGTSLVTPILTFFFASSTVAIADKVGLYAAIIALVISLVTVYLVGLKLAPRLDV